MDNHRHPNHSPITTEHIERLWDKVSASFATKKDVLQIIGALKNLEARPQTTAVQSGNGGPIITTSADGIARIPYESWLESKSVDPAGKEVIAYNDSPNALSTATAALIIKELRQEISKTQKPRIIVCDNYDEHGYPLVGKVDFNTIYLVPSQAHEQDSEWIEWIAVPRQKHSRTRNVPYPYTWEKLGRKDLDLRWVKKDLIDLNNALEKLNNRLSHHSAKISDVLLNKAIKPLEELKNYLNSQEFVSYVFEQLPRAALGSDGLMTSNSYAMLSMLALWASNDHKVIGGGALGPDVVIHLMEKNGIPVDDLKAKYHHHMCCCDD